MNFLVLNGHKFYPFSQGKLNKTLFYETVSVLSEKNIVKTTVVEQGYDVEEEIEKYKWADTVIFQTPVNWFSVPWILKKYFDEVYQHGVFYKGSKDYGKGGLFKGKRYMFSMTWNSPESAFYNLNEFYEGKSPEDIIVALHKMHQYCGFSPIKSFFAFDVVHNPDVPLYTKKLREHLYNYVLNAD